MKTKWEGLRNLRSRYMDPKYQSHTYICCSDLTFKYHLLTSHRVRLGGVGGVGGHENKVGGLRNSRSTSSVFSTSINETSLSNSSINNTGVAVGTCRVVELGTLLRSYF